MGEATSSDDDGVTSAAGATHVDVPSEDEDMPSWPKESLGPYYLDSGLPVGVSDAYLFGYFENIELRPDALVVTRLWCNSSVETEQHAVSFEGDEVYVYPEQGQSAVMWNGVPVAEALVFRPGDTCEGLRTELVEPIAPYAEPGEVWTWRRGAVYISTPYGEDGDLVCGADLSPDVPTECGE